MERIRKEFDHIAVLSECERDPGGTYDSFLSRFIPDQCVRALEVGCGTGAFTRMLAKQANHVTAIDLSSEMIRVARQRSTDYRNIEFAVGDILEMDLPDSWYDCIVMIGTLHHLPTKPVLEKIIQVLTADGVFILHDPLRPDGAIDRGFDVVRLPMQIVARWIRTGRPWSRREVRRAWAEHGKHERYLTKREVRAMTDRYLREGYVKYHLLWRYTVIWYKQGLRSLGSTSTVSL